MSGHDCEIVKTLLADSLEQDVSETSRRFVKLHLDRCDGCARLAAELAAPFDVTPPAPLPQ